MIAAKQQVLIACEWQGYVSDLATGTPGREDETLRKSAMNHGSHPQTYLTVHTHLLRPKLQMHVDVVADRWAAFTPRAMRFAYPAGQRHTCRRQEVVRVPPSQRQVDPQYLGEMQGLRYDFARTYGQHDKAAVIAVAAIYLQQLWRHNAQQVGPCVSQQLNPEAMGSARMRNR